MIIFVFQMTCWRRSLWCSPSPLLSDANAFQRHGLISVKSFPVARVSNLPLIHLICCRSNHRAVREWYPKLEYTKQADYSRIGVQDIDKDDNPPLPPLNVSTPSTKHGFYCPLYLPTAWATKTMAWLLLLIQTGTIAYRPSWISSIIHIIEAYTTVHWWNIIFDCSWWNNANSRWWGDFGVHRLTRKHVNQWFDASCYMERVPSMVWILLFQ